jgi:uncharacterized protein (TIGR03084 family)
MAATQDVLSDLTAEGDELDRMIADLDPDRWSLATPAPGWPIRHQIAHLTATFGLAGLAASDGETFTRLIGSLSEDFDANVAAAMAPHLVDPPVLLHRFREARTSAIQALADVPAGETVPWLVRPLPAPVLAAAGLMELFGHGQDVADALGIEREYNDSVGHLCFFGARVWDFGYLARGLAVPDVALRFELTAPSGTVWTFGPDDAEQRITGPAVDFALLVSRRRHRDDLSLTATGADADQWLDIAQAYRGPAGAGRAPGQFSPLRTA